MLAERNRLVVKYWETIRQGLLYVT